MSSAFRVGPCLLPQVPYFDTEFGIGLDKTPKSVDKNLTCPWMLCLVLMSLRLDVDVWFGIPGCKHAKSRIKKGDMFSTAFRL